MVIFMAYLRNKLPKPRSSSLLFMVTKSVQHLVKIVEKVKILGNERQKNESYAVYAVRG
jgi:hypothetical protein